MKLPDINNLPPLEGQEVSQPEENKSKSLGMPALGDLPALEPKVDESETSQSISSKDSSNVEEMPDIGLGELRLEPLSNNKQIYEETEDKEDDYENYQPEEYVPSEEDMMNIIPKEDFEFSYDDDNDVGQIIPVTETPIPEFEDEGVINEDKINDFLANIKSKFKRNKKSRKPGKKKIPVVKIILSIIFIIGVIFGGLKLVSMFTGNNASASTENISISIKQYEVSSEGDSFYTIIQDESEIETTYIIHATAKSGFLGLSKTSCSSDIITTTPGGESDAELHCESPVSEKSKLSISIEEL